MREPKPERSDFGSDYAYVMRLAGWAVIGLELDRDWASRTRRELDERAIELGLMTAEELRSK